MGVRDINNWYALASVEYVNVFKSRNDNESRFVVAKANIWVANPSSGEKTGTNSDNKRIMKTFTMQGKVCAGIYNVRIK